MHIWYQSQISIHVHIYVRLYKLMHTASCAQLFNCFSRFSFVHWSFFLLLLLLFFLLCISLYIARSITINDSTQSSIYHRVRLVIWSYWERLRYKQEKTEVVLLSVCLSDILSFCIILIEEEKIYILLKVIIVISFQYLSWHSFFCRFLY